MNDEALRTFMCEAEAVVNSWPLMTESITSPGSAEALTSNHFLTLKMKGVLPPPGVFTSADLYSRKWWWWVQHLTNEFWCRWRKEFLLSLQEQQKWTRPRKNLKVDDVVILKDNDTPRNQWKVCRVAEALPDEDGLVREVRLEIGSSNLALMEREVSLCPRWRDQSTSWSYWPQMNQMSRDQGIPVEEPSQRKQKKRLCINIPCLWTIENGQWYNYVTICE